MPGTCGLQRGAISMQLWDIGQECGRSWSSTLPWTDCLWHPLQPWAPSVGQSGGAASTLCAQRDSRGLRTLSFCVTVSLPSCHFLVSVPHARGTSGPALDSLRSLNPTGKCTVGICGGSRSCAPYEYLIPVDLILLFSCYEIVILFIITRD